mgnify:CR=1 FL=1
MVYTLVFFFDDKIEDTDPTIIEEWNHVPQINSKVMFDHPSKYQGIYTVESIEYFTNRNRVFVTLNYYDCL